MLLLPKSSSAASVPSVTRICFCRPRGLALSQMRSYSENSFKMQNVNVTLPYQVTWLSKVNESAEYCSHLLIHTDKTGVRFIHKSTDEHIK